METEDEYDIKTYTEHLNYCFNNKLDSGYPVGVMINANWLNKSDFSRPDLFHQSRKKMTQNRIYL